ncbi:MAG: hypothetical protein ACJ8DC_19105 [Gemmatimonadales bacterium]
MSMDQAEFDLLSQFEGGEAVFRPAGRTEDERALFVQTVRRLLGLRERGWVRFTDGRIARSQHGVYLMVGPCDLTETGRRALEEVRRLKPLA